jgi:hypothetical protein
MSRVGQVTSSADNSRIDKKQSFSDKVTAVNDLLAADSKES